MRPWRHAISSTGKREDWQKDLPIHEFMDMTKIACADRRHRIVLHHVDLGTAIVQMAFPDRHSEIAGIVAKHINEDMGVLCTLDDWFQQIDLDRLPSALPRRLELGVEGIIQMIAQPLPRPMHPGVRRVVEFLFLPSRFCSAPIEKSLSVLMNSMGLFLVRHVFGPPVEIIGHRENSVCVVDYGWIAEATIFTMYGRIPDLREVVASIKSEPGEGEGICVI